MQAHFDKGAMDGKISLIDPRNGKPAAEGSLKAGLLQGKSTVYDTASGTVLHTIGWERGVPNGLEQAWNRDGKLIGKATFVDGKYDGEFTQYEPDGKVKRTLVYQAGVLKRTLRPGLSDAQNCIEDKRQNYKARFGDQIAPLTEHGWISECGGEPPTAGGQNVAPPAAGLPENCTDAWAAAVRRERGEDALVSRGQLEEWTAWCKQGKRPIGT